MIALADLTPCAWDKLPYRPCVYVIHADGVILYVGQTVNMRQRWMTHHRNKQIKTDYPTAIISLYFTDEPNLLETEREFIIDLSPCLNGQSDGQDKRNIQIDQDTYNEIVRLAHEEQRGIAAQLRVILREYERSLAALP
jgi:excinuclease UvrABC nuclease subunit